MKQKPWDEISQEEFVCMKQKPLKPTPLKVDVIKNIGSISFQTVETSDGGVYVYIPKEFAIVDSWVNFYMLKRIEKNETKA